MTASAKFGQGWREGRRTVVAACGLLILLAACGGQSWSSSASPGSPTRVGGRQAVLDSVSTTANAKSARVSLSMSMTGLGALGGIKISGDGAVDFGSGNEQLVMHTGTAGLTFDETVRVVDHVAYVQLGSTSRPWYKIDPSKFGSSSSPSALGGNTDPTQFLAALEAVSDNVHVVGTAFVRGVETTHYQASLDIAKAIDRAKVPPSLRGSVSRLRESMGTLPPIPADVFVDSAGRLRRLEMTFDFSSLLKGKSGATAGVAPTMNLTMDLYDFGTPVNVEAPPASDISRPKDFGQNDGGAFSSSGSSAS